MPSWSVGTGVVASSAASLTLIANVSQVVYVFTGSSAATWTLPVVANNAGITLLLVNRGTAAVTVQRAGTDNIYAFSAVTSINLPAGADVTLVCDGTYWVLMSSPLTALNVQPATRITQLNLNTSTTETDVISLTLPTGVLQAGTTFRITARGTIQVQATSGTLTFRPYVQGVVSTETYQLASQGGAAGPFGFALSVDMTVRTTGASGTYISQGLLHIVNAATTLINVSTTTATTATINTAATSPIVKLTAQWATSSATNILKVETAVLEQVA